MVANIFFTPQLMRKTIRDSIRGIVGVALFKGKG